MPVHYHLIAMTADEAVLTVPVPGGWLLPYEIVDGTMRSASAATRLLDRAQLSGTLIHEAGYPREAPPITRAGVHRYVAVALHADGGASSPHLLARPVAHLRASAAVLPEQRQALEACVGRLGRRDAPFDNPRHFADCQEWTTRIARSRGWVVGDVTRYRAGRFDAVMRFDSTGGPLYVKAGPHRVRDEAALTAILDSLVPGSVPRTLAVEPVQLWWLAEGVEGRVLAHAPDAVSVAQTAAALAVLQQRSCQHPPLMELLSDRRFDGHESCRLIVALFNLYEQHADVLENAQQDRLTSARAACVRACERTAALRLPLAWVHSDLSLCNVIVERTHATFVDCEDAFLAPPHLALWRLMEDLKSEAPDGALGNVARDAFVEAWRPFITQTILARAFADLDLVGRLLNVKLMWRRLDRRLLESDLTPSSVRYARGLEPHMVALIEAATGQQAFCPTNQGGPFQPPVPM